MVNKKKHYFTFGNGQRFGGYYQPIIAPDAIIAREKMFEVHGSNWSFQYSESEWNKSLAEGYFAKAEPLEIIICDTPMLTD